jgi:hypothetical protein
LAQGRIINVSAFIERSVKGLEYYEPLLGGTLRC